MYKRLLSLSFILALCVINAHAFAASPKDYWYVTTDQNGEIVLHNNATGETITEAFRFTETGERVPVDLQFYANELNESIAMHATTEKTMILSSDALLRGPSTYAYTFEESSTEKKLGESIKVTSDIRGPATVTYGESVTIMDSFGGDISITAKIENAIEAGASFTWNKSLSSSSQFSVAYDVPAGRIGYIKFTPYYNISSGTIVRRLYSPSLIKTDRFPGWGKSPIKLSTGFADGVYALVKK